MKKTKVKMNKPMDLGISILGISKTLMCGFWYDYIKSEDYYKDIANDVERWFDTSSYDKNDDRSPPIGKNKKVIGLFKDELGGKIMKEFSGIRTKT